MHEPLQGEPGGTGPKSRSRRELTYSGIPDSVLKQLRTIHYQDSGDSHAVRISGGPGFPHPSDGSANKAKSMLASWDTGAAGAATTSVATGSAGGSAECYTDDAKDVTCAWVNGNLALLLEYTGYDAKSAQALVPQILTAVVH